MLDTETKHRIDTARNILVGKVPVPNSQVEQITIALIYKFMDDMDKESLVMGGKVSFFSGDFEKYSWSKIFDPHLGGYEMLALYSEAIARMGQNPNLPQLFRDIFKNAYLPYRDPETLKLFLKTINEFSYDHSERLGDAFEYLLSVLGSQGDAGQFRTPRHIIDFMVQVLQPQKNESILDPACGTAGFLISAYKYILHTNTQKTRGDQLTPDDKKQLMSNFRGYDISPDMVRLSLVNMYLHGFVQPQIYDYDTLTSDERWNEYADVILANPPFMSPHGGIRPHNRFGVQSKRSEVLFVDYMAEHLTPTGRAAIIVPEGIIFQSGNAYKQLRKMLLEDGYLWAVVSLPSGVFNPYAGVKTSILFLDKWLAKKSEQVLFVKAEADGFDLGAQRRAVERNDLPDALKVLHEWQSAMRSGREAEFVAENQPCSALLVAKSRLANGGEYNLSGERYRENAERQSRFPKVPLGDLLRLEFGTRITKHEHEGTLYPVYGGGGESFRTDSYTREDNVVVSRFAMSPQCVRVITGRFYLLDSGFTYSISDRFVNCVSKSYITNILLEIQSDIYGCARGHAQKNIDIDAFRALRITLPPLEVQKEIVAEIEGYQRIIDGARQVVEAWKPNLELELEEERKRSDVEAWELVKLGDVLNFIGSGMTPFGGKETYLNNGVLFIRSQNVLWGMCDFSNVAYISQDVHNEMTRSKVQKNDVLLNITGASIGRSAIFIEDKEANVNQHVTILRCKENIYPSFLMSYLISIPGQEQIWSMQSGASRQALNYQQIRVMKIPLPPLDVQHAIVERIEVERRAVEGNRQLMRIYAEKTQRVIARVWEQP